jgi:HD superfamily phosphohydrolase YqeK
VHDVLVAAAEGALPEWAVASPERRAHMGRVAELLGSWALAGGRGEQETIRWRALGQLHDVLRDEDFETLRACVPPDLRSLPGEILHGPAAAERLRVEGVDDGRLLRAIAFHTLGDPAFDDGGRALYAADFLDPGRSFLAEWRAELRRRMPQALDDVVFEIARARITNLVERGSTIRPRSLAFWNALVTDRR